MIRIFEDTFKTISIKIYTAVTYQKAHVMASTMMSRLMKISSPKYPNKKLFVETLETLFGATVNTSSGVLGNQALFTSTIRLISGKMVNEHQLLKEVLSFAIHNIFEQTFIDVTLFEQEKRILLHQYRTLENHKMQYAHIKYKEKILAHHPEHYPLDDQIKDLESLTLDDVRQFYTKHFLHGQRIAYATGPLTDEEKTQLSHDLDPFLHQSFSVKHTAIELQKPQQDILYLKMEQAIIHLGYHFPVFLGEKDHVAAQLMTMILGTHGDSRLFRIVRQEQGLCYMVTAQYDDEKGLLTVITGVDIQSQEKSIKSIKKVVSSMTETITDKELHDAKQSFIHMITSNLDEQNIYIKRAFRETIYNRPYDLNQRLKDIQSVTKTDINRVANQLSLILEHRVVGKNHE